MRVRRVAADVSSETLTVGNITRSFRLVVPHKLPKPCAVVFAFHGIGDSTDSMASYSRLDRVASDNGFILVYPAGKNGMWASRDVGPDAFDDNSDVQFFDALCGWIASRFEIDLARIYAIGMSNGASFTQLLAHARSSEIAAVVAHSGASPQGLHAPDRRFPVLLIVGGDDPAVTSMKSDADRYNTSGHEAEIIIVDGLGHEWSRGHNAQMWKFLAEHQLAR